MIGGGVLARARADLEDSELERREVKPGIDGGRAIIGGGRSVLTKHGAAELDFNDDSGMRTIGARASDPLEELLDRRVLLLLLLLLDRTGDLDLLLERRRR